MALGVRFAGGFLVTLGGCSHLAGLEEDSGSGGKQGVCLTAFPVL